MWPLRSLLATGRLDVWQNFLKHMKKSNRKRKSPRLHRNGSGVPGSGRCPGEEIATHPSTFTWKSPWTEEAGKLQSMESQSHTQLSNFTSMCVWLPSTLKSAVCIPALALTLAHEELRLSTRGLLRSPQVHAQPETWPSSNFQAKVGAFQSFYFPELLVPEHFLQNFTGRLLFPIN